MRTVNQRTPCKKSVIYLVKHPKSRMSFGSTAGHAITMHVRITIYYIFLEI